MAVWLFLVAASSLLLPTHSADKTLFDDNDHVVIYKEATYQKGYSKPDNTHQSGLYVNEQAHLFLLYSSWCGHCQAFAPKYKLVLTFKTFCTIFSPDILYNSSKFETKSDDITEVITLHHICIRSRNDLL